MKKLYSNVLPNTKITHTLYKSSISQDDYIYFFCWKVNYNVINYESENQSGSKYSASTLGVLTSSEESMENPFLKSTISYPCPFDNIVNIRFLLSMDSFVKIHLFNSEGKEVKSLLGKKLIEGEHHIQFDGSDLSTGIYLYTIDLSNDLLSGTIIKK